MSYNLGEWWRRLGDGCELCYQREPTDFDEDEDERDFGVPEDYYWPDQPSRDNEPGDWYDEPEPSEPEPPDQPGLPWEFRF